MKPVCFAILLLLTPGAVLAAPSQGAMAQGDAAMAAVAGGFLTVYGSFHPSDGIPNAAGRARYAPFLSARLNQMLADAAAAELRFDAKNKNSPPLLEGDLFTSMFEGATAWTIGACSGDGKIGRCPLSFTHADPGKKPVAWIDTLLLVNSGSGWRIDDVAYGGGFQFGNTGKLTDTLQAVPAEAP